MIEPDLGPELDNAPADVAFDDPPAEPEPELLAADIRFDRWSPDQPGRHSGETSDGKPPESALTFVSIRDLIAQVATAGARRWLFRGVWPARDYGVHSAEMKAQKTWTTIDAIVSAASGTPFLGRFPADDPGPVVAFYGEGGAANIVRRLQGVAVARGVDLAALPIVVCVRAPHLTTAAHLHAVEDQLTHVQPKLVTLDPLYLAARGASGADLYAMGAMLEDVQRLCSQAGASLWVVTHHNRKQGQGTTRISGAGPAEWGRVLITAEVKSRHTDPVTKATDVLTELDFIGGEIPDYTIRVRRRIWADDPDSLDSPLHVETTTEEGEMSDATTRPDLGPAATKLLEALQAVGPATGSALVDWIKAHHGHGLRRETTSRVLGDLERRNLVDSVEVAPFRPKLWRLTGPCDPCDIT